MKFYGWVYFELALLDRKRGERERIALCHSQNVNNKCKVMSFTADWIMYHTPYLAKPVGTHHGVIKTSSAPQIFELKVCFLACGPMCMCVFVCGVFLSGEWSSWGEHPRQMTAIKFPLCVQSCCRSEDCANICLTCTASQRMHHHLILLALGPGGTMRKHTDQNSLQSPEK